MIAVDTSAFILFFHGSSSSVVALVDKAFESEQVVLPPVVLSEMLSDHKISSAVAKYLDAIPLIELSKDYWSRAGRLRATILKKGLRARLADTLIAQACIDNKVPLITADSDFRHFAKYSELELIY